jgi:hypothetical protein
VRRAARSPVLVAPTVVAAAWRSIVTLAATAAVRPAAAGLVEATSALGTAAPTSGRVPSTGRATWPRSRRAAEATATVVVPSSSTRRAAVATSSSRWAAIATSWRTPKATARWTTIAATRGTAKASPSGKAAAAPSIVEAATVAAAEVASAATDADPPTDGEIAAARVGNR